MFARLQHTVFTYGSAIRWWTRLFDVFYKHLSPVSYLHPSIHTIYFNQKSGRYLLNEHFKLYVLMFRHHCLPITSISCGAAQRMTKYNHEPLTRKWPPAYFSSSNYSSLLITAWLACDCTYVCGYVRAAYSYYFHIDFFLGFRYCLIVLFHLCCMSVTLLILHITTCTPYINLLYTSHYTMHDIY